jgi:serine/threonine protein kinase
MHNQSDGFPITSLREINILSALQHHPNIIHLKEVVVGYKKDSVFLAFDYCEGDMALLVDYLNKREVSYLNIAEIKCLILQLIKAVGYLHDHDILHRDLKLSNLLINKDGCLKMADFGLARRIGYPLGQYTPKVVTLWYRSPEILLRHPSGYSKPADTWGIGCILAELLNFGRPIMPGNNEIDQFKQMAKLLGRPNSGAWPHFNLVSNSKHLASLVSDYKHNTLA